MKTKILISTCKEYFDKTIPKLIDNILNSDIDISNVLIVSGGEDKDSSQIINGIEVQMVKYRCFEFTSIIYAIENNIDCDYIFLSHDYVEFSKDFYSNITKYAKICMDNNYETANLKCNDKYTLAMNIGLYSYDFLEKNKDFIINLKFTNNNTDYLNKIKKDLVYIEDKLFKISNSPQFSLTTKEKVEIIEKNVSDKKIYVRKLIYDEIGFVKYQQNYKLIDNMFLDPH
jgi:hypothetical protein